MMREKKRGGKITADSQLGFQPVLKSRQNLQAKTLYMPLSAVCIVHCTSERRMFGGVRDLCKGHFKMQISFYCFDIHLHLNMSSMHYSVT